MFQVNAVPIGEGHTASDVLESQVLAVAILVDVVQGYVVFAWVDARIRIVAVLADGISVTVPILVNKTVAVVV